MEHCKKLSSWDIYGVRQFPYRGNRKYTPGVNRSFYGSISIQNDVFGLTIYQFEREFKACLDRRKKNEQLILNIRFPAKTAKEYIEYLKYEDANCEGYTPVIEHQCTGINLSDEDRMSRYLTQVAGTELEIRTRQRMFIVKDTLINKASDVFRYISSGSLAEGIDLPGSDVDIMYELMEVSIIDDLKYLYTSMVHTKFLMENDERYPGFCKLKFVSECCQVPISHSLKETNNGLYISTERVIHQFGNLFTCNSQCRHGPCLSDADQNVDKAFCLRSKLWPKNAINWILRHRPGQWPTGNLINTVVNDGCLFVPIGPKNECSELLWRISFSLAEKRLTHSMNYTQLLCYILLKLTLKNIINRNDDVKDLLCSYFLKTAVFWLSEEICIDTFKITNLSFCFSLCIDKLMSFVRNCYCPNYFIPQHNMFIGKVDNSNNKILLSILAELKNIELKFIIDQMFGNSFFNHSLCTMTAKNTSVDLELLFYRIATCIRVEGIDRGYQTLHYIRLLMESESSQFMLGVLVHYHAVISQRIAQMVYLPNHRRLRYNIIRRCSKHLMDGTKSDAVSGWLLYASFYYVLGKYKKTLQIVDKVLPRCTPDMIPLEKGVYTTEDRNKYKQKSESYFTLNHKMTKATVANLLYIRKSTLIPHELQLEVQNDHLTVELDVLCHCLQFLCYHHLGDFNNKQRALDELNLTIKQNYFVGNDHVHLSDSLVILGVCCEIAGHRDTAHNWYYNALHCKHRVSRSAEQRIVNLFSTHTF